MKKKGTLHIMEQRLESSDSFSEGMKARRQQIKYLKDKKLKTKKSYYSKFKTAILRKSLLTKLALG